MEFSEAYVNHVFNKSVEGVFAEFRRGFFTVCEEDAALLFRPEELRAVMVGSENYDWEKLKKVLIPLKPDKQYIYRFHDAAMVSFANYDLCRMLSICFFIPILEHCLRRNVQCSPSNHCYILGSV